MLSRMLIPVGLGALLLSSGAQPLGCEDELTCEERIQESNAYVYGVIEDYQSCAVDDDCTMVSPGTQCRGACPVPVSVDGLEEVQAAVAYANETWCDGFMQDGCPYLTPSCVYFEPACRDGMCVGVNDL